MSVASDFEEKTQDSFHDFPSDWVRVFPYLVVIHESEFLDLSVLLPFASALTREVGWI